MSTPTLTPAQMELAMAANRLQLAGFPGAAAAIVRGLRQETGLRADPREAANARSVAETSGNRSFYGSFKLTEADECAMENVETPGRS